MHYVEKEEGEMGIRGKGRRFGIAAALFFVFLFLAFLLLVSCGPPKGGNGAGGGRKLEEGGRISQELVYTHSMDIRYAKGFSVDYYERGYVLFTLSDTGRFLAVPEGLGVPEDLSPDIVPLRQPVQQVYLAASGVMDMFVALDALDVLGFSGLRPEGWYIPEARKAMERGDILYAGSYGEPDYERILSGGCSLAIENTMVYHVPEVAEQLRQFSIPVLVDLSSREEEPLGRMEWVRLYGALLGKEEEAKAVFSSQEAKLKALEGKGKSGKTVAFFYITADGKVNVRKSSDYLAKMINLAGGDPMFPDLGAEGGSSSTVALQMEEFYATARDADYLVYNGAVDGGITCVDELVAKHRLLGEFKAVQEGRVFCTEKNLYQSSMKLGTITEDIYKMLEQEGDGMVFIYRLEQ